MRRILPALLLLGVGCAHRNVEVEWRLQQSLWEYAELPDGMSAEEACRRVAEAQGPLEACFQDRDRLYYLPA